MKKKIVLQISSKPFSPELGYGDHYQVYEGDYLAQGGHCSSCPNPYRPSDKRHWMSSYGWVANQETKWECIDHPKYGKCLLINNGEEIKARNRNTNHGGRKVLDNVLWHEGGFGCKNKQWRGSAGCLTCSPDEWLRFISCSYIGEKGKLVITDLIKEDSPMASRKSMFKSKTIWVNLASVALVVVDKLTGADVIPKDVALIIIPIINLVLRKLTRKAI